MLRITRCVLLVVSCLLLVSCARTVTQIVTYGSQMMVEVTLRGTMEVDTNRYFLILSASPTFEVPLPPPENISFECLEPDGTTLPQQGSLEAYYTKFFSTWAGYVIIEPGGYFSVQGPFNLGQAITREVISSLREKSSKITFSFGLDRIFATVPDIIYFDFVTVPWPSEGAKIPADHLTSTNAYISKVTGSIVTVTDDENPGIDPAVDIKECKVTIQ